MDYEVCKRANREVNRREVEQGAVRVRSLPLRFGLSITGRCNLHCCHCLARTQGRTDAEMPDGIYDKIVQSLMPTAEECHLGGGNLGEMTISPRFPRVLRDCRTYQVGVVLTTNGTCIAEQWLGDLVECLTVIGFSMEGMEAQYEKIRGHRWDLFLKNVEKVLEARAQAAKTFRVEWRYCVHADNVQQLPAMIRLAKRMGVDHIQVMNLIPFRREQRFKTLYYHRSLANEYLDQARAAAEETGLKVSMPGRFEVGSFECGGDEGAATRPTVRRLALCPKPWQECSIDEFGVVRPCHIHWRALGSLEKHPFAAVWNGRRFRRLRRAVNRRPASVCAACRLSRFDGEDNLSQWQLRPGLRELLRGLWGRKAVRYEFVAAPGELAGEP